MFMAMEESRLCITNRGQFECHPAKREALPPFSCGRSWGSELPLLLPLRSCFQGG